MNLEEKRVQEELSRVDPLLFLDKLYDKEGGYIYYAIRYPVGDGVEPLTCVHWRTVDGPLPLNLDIVSLVRRQEGDIRDAIKEVTVNNAVKRMKAADDYKADMEERAEWIQKSSKRLGIYGPWENKYNLP